jgi:hypothetical protein
VDTHLWTEQLQAGHPTVDAHIVHGHETLWGEFVDFNSCGFAGEREREKHTNDVGEKVNAERNVNIGRLIGKGDHIRKPKSESVVWRRKATEKNHTARRGGASTKSERDPTTRAKHTKRNGERASDSIYAARAARMMRR